MHYKELFRNIEFVNEDSRLCALLQVSFKVHNSIMIALSQSQGCIENGSKDVNLWDVLILSAVRFDTESYGFKRLFKEIYILL
jgi:hypothetical protein